MQANSLLNFNQNLESKFEKIAKGICYVISLIFLLWISWHIFYAVPWADDFCYGEKTIHFGILQSNIIWYFNWSGRFVSNFFLTTFSSNSNILLNHYYLVPLSIFIAYLGAIYYFLKKLDVKNYLLLLVLFALILAVSPLSQSLFWLAGGATYGLSSALFIVLLTEEMHIYSGNLTPSWKRILILSALSIFLAGFNETVMMAHIALLIILCLMDLKREKTLSVKLLILLSSAIIGACIVGFAPGTLSRALSVTPEKNILWAALHSLVVIFKRYFLHFIFCTLCFIGIFSILLQKFSKRIPLSFITGLFFSLWAAVFSRIYAISYFPSRARAIDVVLILIMAFIFAMYLYQKYNENILKNRKKILLLFCFFSFGLIGGIAVYGINDEKILRQIRNTVILKKQMTARFDFLKNTKEQYIEVEPFTETTPRPLTFFNDIETDSNDWKNTCKARYFGVKILRLKSEE